MLLLPQESQRKIEEMEHFASPHTELNESWFQAYAIKVISLAEVELGYMKVCQMKRFADHIMVAYHIKISETEIQEGCAVDKEHYGDLETLKVMKVANVVNAAVFVAREYGGWLLGKARFPIIRQVATKALQEMEPETHSLPPQQTRPKGQRTNQQHLNRGSRGRGVRTRGGGRGGGRTNPPCDDGHPPGNGGSPPPQGNDGDPGSQSEGAQEDTDSASEVDDEPDGNTTQTGP